MKGTAHVSACRLNPSPTVETGRQPIWGGVCRGSLSQIVNIVGGGGVLPLLTAEVAAKLERAFHDQLPAR
jgi:hypothetical protein